MKQVLVKGGQVQIEEVPPPALGEGMCLVRVSHSLISSGTESLFSPRSPNGMAPLEKPRGKTQAFFNRRPRNPAAGSADFSRHLGRRTLVRGDDTHGRLKSPF